MITHRFSLALGLMLLSTHVANASYETGREALDRDDPAAAVEEWRPVAQRGDAKAQYALGQIFEKGADGVAADLVEAFAWFKLAAAQDFEAANDAVERLRAEMTPEQLQEAQSRSLAALGFWFRDFTGQDEATFQETKAATVVPQPQQTETVESLAEQRAAAQRELIEQRKAEAEAKAKALEESRQAAIRAAQEQAEEAKRQAELREKQIEEQRRAIAQKDAQQSQNDMATARARLAALMAKQTGTDASADTALKTGTPETSAAEQATAAAATPPQKMTAVEAPKPETSVEKTAVTTPAPGPSPQKLASTPEKTPDPAAVSATKIDKVAPTEKVEAAASPMSAAKMEVAPTPKQEEAVQKVALAKEPEPVKTTTVQNPPASALSEEKSEALASLKSLDGLDRDAVEQIFEQAKIADLDTAAAQAEIEKSLTRIEALKWSLISGAKGDKAAPKMNKVLMSRMSDVQIAEANRLAGQWLIDEQKQL